MNIALTGIAVFALSVLGGWILVKRNSPEQPTQVKAVLFGLYFWGLAFLQLLIVAAVYYLLK
jgi:uncharacterized membrane protein